MPEERVDGEDDGIDLGQIKATYEPLIFGDSDAEEEDTAVVPSAGHTAPVQPEYRPRLVQDAFQPGSTPVHLQHRFMVWNSVGMVRAHNTAEESSIDVEFHDTSVHHALHRGNTQGHTMAALSEKALVLAGPQQLECLHLGSWDANKEWAVDTLSDGIQ
ncbi:WD repeat and HMG-box DNA-binding protein 1, partial [Dermacentor silvarum]